MIGVNVAPRAISEALHIRPLAAAGEATREHPRCE